MKTLPLSAFAFSLSLIVAAPALAGGKASDRHAQARATKAEVDAAAEKKAEARAAAEKAGVKPADDAEKDGWVWKHRPVRHKQTMPAAPKLRETESK